MKKENEDSEQGACPSSRDEPPVLSQKLVGVPPATEDTDPYTVHDELREAHEETRWALREAVHAGERAARALAMLDDALDATAAEGKAGPWVLVYGEPGAGALYLRSGVCEQTPNINDAARFDVFQRKVRSVNRRTRCISLAEAEAAIAKARGER